MADYALVLNAGSSSLKFSVYERLDEQDWRPSSRGQVEGIETAPRITVKDVDGNILTERRLAGESQDIHTSLEGLRRGSDRHIGLRRCSASDIGLCMAARGMPARL